MVKTIPPIILASKSPRRQDLLSQMGFNFRVALKEVDESYPDNLSAEQVPVFIAEKKAHAFDLDLRDSDILLTADTIVTIDNLILGKPESEEQAIRMLECLSNRTHQVITGVTLMHKGCINSFYDVTEVSFAELSSELINYYISNYKPFDKAGSYGIQDWIGLVAIRGIKGSYSNVVGLPTEKLYQKIVEML